MDLIELSANIRNTKGNGPARRLRREGRIPAVLYGPGSEPAMLSVDTRDLELILKKNNAAQTVFTLSIDGAGAGKTAMIKELQQNPLSGDLLHADFYEVAMDRKVLVKVPVTTTGKSIGVEMGGMLQIIRRELAVLCYPNQIPEAIEIDITELEVNASVHVEDIQTEGDMEIPADVNFTVLNILGRKAEPVEDELEGEEEGEETAEAAEEAAE